METRQVLAWTRFSRNRTLFQMEPGKHSHFAVPAPGIGFAMWHRIPLASVEMGARAFEWMRLDPATQIVRAASLKKRKRK